MYKINVSLVYATKEQQWIKEVSMTRGSSVSDLIECSDFLTEIDGLKGKTIEELSLGNFAQKVSADTLLEEGDRIEIYRPLTADPKEVRRQLALIGKTIGGK